MRFLFFLAKIVLFLVRRMTYNIHVNKNNEVRYEKLEK